MESYRMVLELYQFQKFVGQEEVSEKHKKKRTGASLHHQPQKTA